MYHKSCFKLNWPFGGFLQLHEVKVQKSHISMRSLHKYHKSCSESHLTVLRLITTLWGKNFKNLISPGFQCTSITNHVLKIICSFYGWLQLYEEKLQKSHISVRWVHKDHQSCSELIWPFYGLLQLYEEELEKIVFLARLTVLRLITTVWGKTSQMFSQIVFSDHLTVLQLIPTVWGKTSKISYLREFSSISITNRNLSLFDCFTAYLQLYKEKLQKSHISGSSVHKYHKSCFRLIWPF